MELQNRFLPRLLLIALPVVFSESGQTAVFHVLSGEIGAQSAGCPAGEPNKTYAQDEYFNLANGALVPMLDNTEVGYENRLGQIVYAKLEDCRNVSDFGKANPRSESLIAIVQEFLSGEKSIAQGGKRLKAGTRSLPNMPTGDVLKPSRAMVLDLSAVGSAAVQRVQLIHLESSTSIVDHLNPKRHIQVSAGKLSYGTGYRWIVDVDDNGQAVRYQDVFRIMDRADHVDYEAELGDVMAVGDPGKMGRLMMQAAVMDAYGLIYDRDRLLKQVRDLQKGR